MKTKPNLLITFLSISIILLTWAHRAAAAGRTIVVQYVTVNVSSITPPLSSADTVNVNQGGTLFVDVDASVGWLNIGDSASAGSVLFNSTIPPQPATLTVANDVTFGVSAANSLDMTVSTANTIRVGGNFLAVGSGTFNAGVGTIEYYSPTAQNVTAKIGGSGTTIQYKNLLLSGSPTTGMATKNFAPGVSVQGSLTITGKAVPAGGFVIYGVLSTLVYAGTTNQVTTTTEWPASLNIPVTINNSFLGGVVTLDSDKTLGASLTLIAGNLNDGGHTLTVLGNINNGTALLGTGKLVLAGSGPQYLTGSGSYGNVVLANNSTSYLPPFPSSISINGRLTIQSGSKLSLPTGTDQQAALLTYGGVDKPTFPPAQYITYGAVGSGAQVQDNTVFDSGATGLLFVTQKPAAIVSETLSTNSITYGDASITISGVVAAPANFATYGNGAQSGDPISIVIGNNAFGNLQTNTTTVLDNSGDYTLVVPTATLVAGTYYVVVSYNGSANLSAAANSNFTLTVGPKTINVTPNNLSTTYGQPDPVLTYTYAPSLVGSDAFTTNGLSRAPGTNVQAYAITGPLTVTANASSYNIVVATGKFLTITPKAISVTFVAQSINYGQNDPPFNRSNVDFTISPQLVGLDSFSGALTRAQAGTVPGRNVGSYAISMGTLFAGPIGFTNYVLTPANAANLTINPLGITVTFASTNKAYGSADPTFTYGVNPALPYSTDGFSGKPGRVSGETVPGSPYTITQGTLSLTNAGNYVVTWDTSGKLAITKVDVVVTAISPTRAYGTPVSLPGDLLSYVGFLPANNPAGVPAQSAPATTQPALNPNIPVTQCSVATNYSFSVTNAGTDPNYNMKLGNSGLSGIVTVTPAPLTVTAVNKTKVADGNPFPMANFSVNYNTFSAACGDNQNNALTGTLVFGGSATNATAPGVYPIIPSGYSSTKYAVSFVQGWLTITAPPGTNAVTGPLTWAGPSQSGNPNTMTSWAWTINQANGGTPAGNPGWSMQQINGTLTIAATPSDQFRLDMVTLAGNVAGLMAKFDPTRPYSWEIVRASGGISGFTSAAQISLNWQAPPNQVTGLFQNPNFNGQFSITQGGNSLYLSFTPMGSTGGNVVAVPPGYDVGTTTNDTTKLLGYIANSDVDLLYLSPSATTVSPQSPVTIKLNVGNLKQAIVGVDAYINFDSRFFVATTGAGAPVVAAGGGVWNNLITKMWNQGGDLDTVVAVGLTATTGTSADGTVATIVLTPTRTAVGTSRVVFRQDGGPKADGTGSLTTDIVPSAQNAQAVLPGRVMTDEITVLGAGVGPVIDTANITATQVQPLVGNVPNPINVKNGTAASRSQTVLTSGGIPGSYPDDTSTASGPVVIKIPASDAGVGLSGPPTLVLSNSPANMVTVQPANPSQTTGTFEYDWTVPANIAQGKWTAIVTAQDTLNPPSSASIATVPNAFTLVVNTTEVSGVVELQGLLGANRLVTFNSGGGSGASNQWDMTLNFVGGDLLNAGAFQDVASFAAVVNQPQDAVSVGLRYGTIPNLPTLAFNLVNQVGGVSAYIYGLEYGSIANLQTLANQLTSPQRPVDTYIISRLSQATIVALATYQSSHGANAAALTKDLLNDFNNIVLGPDIYDPVRFAGVCVTHPTSGTDTVAVNRGLLEDVYVQTCIPYLANYVPGQLQAQTAQELSNYGGGSDPALTADILADFDTLTLTPGLWPTPNQVPYDQGLYNQHIFLGVTLSPATESLLTSQPPVTGTSLTLLNQDLLQDAFAGQYQKAALTPATVVAAQQYPESAQAFVSGATTDLNALINSGTRIYTPAPGTYNPNGELGQLLAMSSLTPDQQIRENRLLLELNYPEQLSQNSVNGYPETGLATFRLVQVPPLATQLSAKTAWNLRVTRPVAATVNFVGNGVPGTFTPASDFYLRAGDMNGDNVVNLLDYNILRINYGTTAGGPADINGDGVVNIFDYYLLQNNYGKSGDPAVQ